MTILSGFGHPREDWDIRDESEKNNAGSIVVRLQYPGNSVLYAGDAIGRHIGDPPDLRPVRYSLDPGAELTTASAIDAEPRRWQMSGLLMALVVIEAALTVVLPALYVYDRRLQAQRE